VPRGPDGVVDPRVRTQLDAPLVDIPSRTMLEKKLTSEIIRAAIDAHRALSTMRSY
jgi:hypothetical protein